MSNNRRLLADYIQGVQTNRNYIINPSGFKNAVKGITASAGATVTRNTTTPLTAISDIDISLTTASSSATFATKTLDNSLSGQTCELKADYTLILGAGATVEAQVLIDSVVVNTLTLPASTTSQQISVIYPCGDLSTATTVSFAQTVAATTSTLRVANVYLGASISILSTLVISPWQTYTPVFTGFGTVTVQNSRYRQVGDVAQIEVTFTTGSPTNATAGVSLPTGLSVASGLPTLSTSGTWFRGASSTAHGGSTIKASGDTAIHFGSQQTFGNGTVVAIDKFTGSTISTSTEILSLKAEVPIAQWAAAVPIVRIGAPGSGQTAWTPTFTGFGTVTAINMNYQCGAGLLQYSGNFTVGTPTAAAASFTLPASFGTALPSKTVGTYVRNVTAASKGGVNLALPGTNANIIYFGALWGSGQTGATSSTGTDVSTTGETLFVHGVVPVTAASPCSAVPMPLIRNAVTTPSVGVEAVLRLNISGSSGVTNCTTADCTVESTNVPGATVARASAGTYTITWPAGTLSAKGSCSCSANSVGIGGTRVICSAFSGGVTTATITTFREDTGGVTDTYSQVICVGPR